MERNERERLAELAKAATPGGWVVRPYDLRGWESGKCAGQDENLGTDRPVRGVAVPSGPPGGFNWITTACEMNAEFIAVASPDTILRLIAALSAAEDRLKWQPIETAPHNVAILVFIPNREHYGEGIYRAMYWNHPERCAPYWFSSGLACGRTIDEYSLPTHWMPLPEPPQS